MRDLRIAARDGDPTAARALLRRNGKKDMAADIRRNRPFPPRVQTMLRALTAGTGTRDQLGTWEWRNEHGEIENDLHRDEVHKVEDEKP
jgi:hypothetical protein